MIFGLSTYSSISFGGRFGRTARISVDGVDISDETVGITTAGIPSSGIQEFQISQSNLELSNELTSSGSVNVITRSGTNAFHGERLEIEPNVGFYNLFNFANYDLPPNVMTGLLNGSPGSVNGTTQADRISNRVGAGTGVFALGAPRQIEFGMRISF